MVGDIPEAEIKPPENVLFVCKLNPVTQEEDLEVIFSRFGKVISADIIRDYKTGDSLCYAFIEFETQEACEAAYFKEKVMAVLSVEKRVILPRIVLRIPMKHPKMQLQRNPNMF
ncbi:hypothetical protein SUGI_0684170 [Cryptomeria japonica]|nr:hypothetical protein SUGI_0684170 [Cryptomeria japonica]